MSHEKQPQPKHLVRKSLVAAGVLAVSGSAMYGLAQFFTYMTPDERPRQDIDKEIAVKMREDFKQLGLAERYIAQYQDGLLVNVSAYTDSERNKSKYDRKYVGYLGQSCVENTSYALKSRMYTERVVSKRHVIPGPKGNSYYYTYENQTTLAGVIAGPASFRVGPNNTSLTVLPNNQGDTLTFTVNQQTGALIPDAATTNDLNALGCNTGPLQITIGAEYSQSDISTVTF